MERLEYLVLAKNGYEIIKYFKRDEKENGQWKYCDRKKFAQPFLDLISLNEKDLKNFKYEGLFPIDEEYLSKIKRYIDKGILDKYYSSYEVFCLACQMGYFLYPDSTFFYNAEKTIKELGEPKKDYENMFELIKTYNESILEKKDIMGIAYNIVLFEELVSACLLEIYRNGYIIKKCDNCGKYFIPFNRSDTLYCDRESPQEPDKTCKKYGVKIAREKKLKTNEAAGIYRSIYMQKQMLFKRNPDIDTYKRDFDKFKEEAKQWKLKIKNNKKTEIEYIEWLKKVKRKEV